MKTLKISSLLVLFMAIATVSIAQTKTETFKVSGNCGMCKSKIEKAAKEAGAASAAWDVDSKQLTVKYNSTSTNAAKIQKKIAGVGYDNAGFKATAEAYDKLHGCCKYERSDDAKAACCSAEKCEMKDGKCADMKACKDKDCCTADGVCKAGTCKHENGEAGCCKKSQ
jgi:periplasmic mercuric ion binding protein